MSETLKFEIKLDPKDHHTLKIYRKGHLKAAYVDYMEPEDSIFVRDLDWVMDEIYEAYKFGLEDGRQEVEMK